LKTDCVDFFFPNASILGAPAISLDELGNLFLFNFLQGIVFQSPGFTGFAAGVPATFLSPLGTIAPTGFVPSNDSCHDSPVIYKSDLNAFLILEKGLYEITYHIQGVFQLNCPFGIQFGVFVGGTLIPSSLTRVTTGASGYGEAFHVRGTLCLFFDKDATCNSTKDESCNLSLHLPSNAVQVRAIIDPNDTDALLCLSTLSYPTRTGTGTTTVFVQGIGFITVSFPTYSFMPAGSLLPDNAFEITFK
jgi:hypothetical protein